MSKETRIEVITYEQERLNFFTKAMNLAQKRYNRLFKIFKDDPYLSEGTTMVSDAGRESQFYHDVVEMLENGNRKQSEWISVDERLPEDGETVLTINSAAEMEVCFYETAWEGIFQQYNGLVKIYNITHWMPLPEPPKMKGGAE